MTVALVRDATDADIDALSDVQTRSWQIGYRGQLPQTLLAGLDSDRRAAGWRQLLEENEALELLVSLGELDQVTGFICVEASRDDDATEEVGEVIALYVDPDRWGRGTGAALLGAGVERLRQLGYTSASLWVLATNERTRRFYEREGWQPDGCTKSEEAGGATFNEVRYVRGL